MSHADEPEPEKHVADVTLALTRDQALVFYEWLAREDDAGRLPTEHQAEQNVLWQLEAQLDRQLVEPFDPDYMAMVAAARERIVRGDTR